MRFHPPCCRSSRGQADQSGFRRPPSCVSPSTSAMASAHRALTARVRREGPAVRHVLQMMKPRRSAALESATSPHAPRPVKQALIPDHCSDPCPCCSHGSLVGPAGLVLPPPRPLRRPPPPRLPSTHTQSHTPNTGPPGTPPPSAAPCPWRKIYSMLWEALHSPLPEFPESS